VTNGYRVEASGFLSAGVRCGADLYLPESEDKSSLVVMAHGFGAERTFRLPTYAAHFARNGMAVLLFDYRTFGDSEGTPRNLVDPDHHVADWKAAIAHARTIPTINRDRIALWGTSYSGGHCIVCAAQDDAISAMIAQVPFLDPYSSIAHVGMAHLLWATPHGILDVVKARLGLEPHYVKLVDRPGRFAAMNTPESLPGMLSIVPNEADWQNRVCARILFKFPIYRPLRFASRVKCPALLMLAENDSLVTPASIRSAAKRMTNAQVIAYPFGHFDIYHGEAFNDAIAKQTGFLTQHLQS
jgi:alpha-beta hydrolase superfamily lysophospholipase